MKFYGRAGEDYPLWAARTEVALHAKKAMSVVKEDIIGDGSSVLDSELEEKVSDARAIIVEALGDKALRLCFSDIENPFRMWQKQFLP